MPLLKTFSSQVILVELVYYLYFTFCTTVNTATGKSFVIYFIPVSEDSEHTLRVTFLSGSVKIAKQSKEQKFSLNSTRN